MSRSSPSFSRDKMTTSSRPRSSANRKNSKENRSFAKKKLQVSQSSRAEIDYTEGIQPTTSKPNLTSTTLMATKALVTRRTSSKSRSRQLKNEHGTSRDPFQEQD